VRRNSSAIVFASPKETRQAAQIEKDFPLEDFEPRREFARDLEQRVRRSAFSGIHGGEHINLRSPTR
jgi:hypothetical protein